MPQEHTPPPIFVAGSGRSGTTWIGGAIASCKGCISVFEPMHQDKMAEAPRWGIHCGLPGPYLSAGNSYDQWEVFFDALLAGRVSNHWTRQDWTRVPKILTRWQLSERIGFRLAKIQYHYRELRALRCVIKEIRANLMLDWLTSYTGAPIVYLIRHPCAVIGSRMSRMRQKELDWEADMEEILCQPHLMADFLEPFRKTISGPTTPLRCQAILWCVENFVPIRQARSNDWLVCCYEEFLSDHDEAFERVFRSLGLEATSITARVKNEIVCNPTHDLNKKGPWHAPLTEEEGEEVLRICEEFGLRLYGRQRMPLCAPRDFIDSAFLGHTQSGGSTGDLVSSGFNESPSGIRTCDTRSGQE